MSITETREQAQAPEQKPKKKRSGVFPMHLTPFEHYMLVDDQPEYPMTFLVELEFSGDIDREAFTNALDDALQRHPLLRAIIAPAKQNRDCWVDANGLKPLVDFDTLGEKIELKQGEFLDLRKEVGLRIWVRHNAERTVLTMQFHHAACDGIGSYQFIGDLLWFYARRTDVDTLPELPELDQKIIRKRGQVSFDAGRFMENGKFRMEWGEVLRMLMRRITPLRRNRNANGPVSDFHGIQSLVFDKNEYRDIRLAAQDSCQTPNDYLIEKLFYALGDWNRKHGRLPWQKNLGVMLPLDLRKPGNEFPAANFLSYAFIQRRERLLKDRDALAKSICEELAILKRDRSHSKFLNMIAGGLFYPKILQRILSPKRCLGTAILSNTGDPTKQFRAPLPREKGVVKCGNLSLESIIGVPPIRTNTHATISIFTYRRELRVCVRLDPHQFSKDDTQQLLEMYVAKIRDGVNR